LFLDALLIEPQLAGFVSSTWPPLADTLPGIDIVNAAAALISVAIIFVLSLLAEA
jgi:hypothetical protein